MIVTLYVYIIYRWFSFNYLSFRLFLLYQIANPAQSKLCPVLLCALTVMLCLNEIARNPFFSLCS